jgi:hypothetical protein
MTKYYLTLGHAIDSLIAELKLKGVEVDTGHWQGVSTEGHPDMVTLELLDARCAARIPVTQQLAVGTINPNMPWAEAHFQERVSRVPSNPGEAYKTWPWWSGQFDSTMEQGKFTHTYQERFWPHGYTGIRYPYGDLDSVVDLLRREPYTRQAYFPIFFPEDTGAVHGGRIPCTLGYHFMLRSGSLHCWYEIRSCDVLRHLRDDLYLAVRLVQWVLDELGREHSEESTLHWINVVPGYLYFTAHSLHVHKGDLHLL